MYSRKEMTPDKKQEQNKGYNDVFFILGKKLSMLLF